MVLLTLPSGCMKCAAAERFIARKKIEVEVRNISQAEVAAAREQGILEAPVLLLADGTLQRFSLDKLLALKP